MNDNATAIGIIYLIVFGFYAALSCIPAAIASSKGRSFAGFWLLSFFVPFGFIIGLVWALMIPAAIRERTVVVIDRGETTTTTTREYTGAAAGDKWELPPIGSKYTPRKEPYVNR